MSTKKISFFAFLHRNHVVSGSNVKNLKEALINKVHFPHSYTMYVYFIDMDYMQWLHAIVYITIYT